MKTQKFLFTLLFAAAFATVGFGQITGSDHDFSGESWNSGGQICIVCHTPHNALSGISDAPLWNHEATAASFTVYSSGTMDAVVGQPDESSKLCLSCHDGTVALENFGGTASGTNFINGNAEVGTDISNDHPISFTYNTALATADGDLADPSSVNSGLGGSIDDDMLISGKLQCASCHDVHNSSGVNKLLLKSNAASALCMTCHTK